MHIQYSISCCNNLCTHCLTSVRTRPSPHRTTRTDATAYRENFLRQRSGGDDIYCSFALCQYLPSHTNVQKRQQATVYLDIQIESIDKAWLWDKNKHIYYYCFFGEGTSWTLWRGSLIPTLRASLRLTKASIAPTIRWSRGKFPSDGS